MMKAIAQMQVCKRDGRIVPFDLSRIESAIASAFRAERALGPKDALDEKLAHEVSMIMNAVMAHVGDRAQRPEGVDVERVQDVVEIQLMRRAHYTVARRYIVYREEHKKVRVLQGQGNGPVDEALRLSVVQADGSRQPLDAARIRRQVLQACAGFEDSCAVEELLEETFKSLYDSMTPADIHKAMILAARARIERDPAYGTVAARLLLKTVYAEALGQYPPAEAINAVYSERFSQFIAEGIHAKRLSPKLLAFDLSRIAQALRSDRDGLFSYLGLQTIYDRYLLHIDKRRIETPQYFWMRVAMGLAIEEGAQKNDRAIEFYEVLSTFRFCSATPTLFNAGTPHPQLSSCYLSTSMDDLEHIFKVVADNAKLSKWAGGLGNDWTNVRATGAHIKGTNGESQGVIPFLKVVNDTAVAVNQGGKRKGAVCSYLETWHLDIEEFLDLRKNTGDDRRRTHDMHTANWIPDLFMKRVSSNQEWTLFSPSDVPDLHDLYGRAFENRYVEYERQAEAGTIRLFKRLPAVELWRKMLSRLFESGHPWITWKDPSNIRSPQDHAGVVHSSNLCTEILLNTSQEETAVCNLGSVNLKAHITDGRFDLALLEQTVRTAVRMLDNVIDINYYPTNEARNSNLRHRPVGLGLMGFQDALYKLGISYSSTAAVEYADQSMEAISYFAILASTELARERGNYPTYSGSKWERGLLPIDTIALLESERGERVEMDRTATLDWQRVREAVQNSGMRNSNVMAIAPTATISAIIGVHQSIEPAYRNLYVKSNLSGDFTQVNGTLVEDLKSLGLWDTQMLEEIKYFDGSLKDIPRIPLEIKQRYLTAFEVDPKWMIECGSRRQKWIDMGQSLNLYLADPSGKKLNDMYFAAWRAGLKTTYYLRTLAATQVEKSTLDVNRFGIQPRWMKNQSASGDIKLQREDQSLATPGPRMLSSAAACPIDGSCEACQ
jgi:ribonucleoside-diphosphate reductase alpha chain